MQLMMLVAQWDEGSMANQISLIQSLLESEKTLTMFHTSLMFDQFHFLYAVQTLLDDQEYFNVSYMGKNERRRIAKLKKECPLLQIKVPPASNQLTLLGLKEVMPLRLSKIVGNTIPA